MYIYLYIYSPKGEIGLYIHHTNIIILTTFHFYFELFFISIFFLIIHYLLYFDYYLNLLSELEFIYGYCNKTMGKNKNYMS